MLEPKFQYKNTNIAIPITFAASASVSSIVDLGAVQLRRIVFPATWTTSDVTLYAGETLTDTFRILLNLDGASSSPITLPAIASNNTGPLWAHWTDSVCYLQLQTSIAQASAVTAILVCKPLYQGIHG